MEDNTRPAFSVDETRQILITDYAIDAQEITELTSELDRNYYVRGTDRSEYVFKVAHPSVSQSILDLQNATLKHLAQQMVIFPQLIQCQDHQDCIEVENADGVTYSARLLNYIPGTPLVDFRPHSPELLHDIGVQLGQLSGVMQSFEHSEKRLDYRWNILNLLDIVEFAKDLPDEKLALVEYFVDLYKQDVIPHLEHIPHSFIYNDANDHNILVQSAGLDSVHVAGMIDFGDMAYSPTVAELAVALAYIMMNTAQPLDEAVHVIRGYSSRADLTETEIALLYPLIGARLCLSVCISWYQQKREPDNPHLSISEEGAWQLLKQLREIHPRFAYYVFRNACGMPACPETETVTAWLQGQRLTPILGKPISRENSLLIDMSIDSTIFGNVDDFADPEAFTYRVQQLTKGNIGIGYYDEARPIYRNDMFAVSHHERRSIHIGVDLCQPPETLIYAPLAGTVYSVCDNAGDQDYGPTLILEHHPEPEIRFYTLYGHLHESVLEKWQVGDQIKAGDPLATIGNCPRNGNWFPHLHFQIIVDMLDKEGEFPGVISPTHRDVWLSLSPNPNLILDIPYDIQSRQSTSHDAILTQREAHLNPAMSLSFKKPLKIERGYLHYLYDENGQAYLDCVNNVPHVGHSNPRVVRAGRSQMGVLNTNTRYLHDTITEYAGRLCATLPDPLSVCFFVNSGSEANELAIRLAQIYTGGTDFIVIDHAYHGHTSALIDLSPYKFNGRGGQGQPDHVEVVTMPDGFRGEVRGFDAQAGQHYAQSVNDALERIQRKNKQVAAFFAEGIMGCGGQMPLPETYLKTAYEYVRKAGGVCVADEVQTGFGRVGTHFWSFEKQGIIPDIVTMGKPMGNGHPLAAVVTTREIADAFDNGMEYFNTFGGNPVSCAIGLEVLTILQEDELQQNALEVGNYWMEQLRELGEEYPIIGHVRGSGLFLGVELIRNPKTLEPADKEAAYIVERMKQKGILLSTEGPYHNVLKMKPPIIFQHRHVDQFMSAFKDVLNDTVLQ